MSARPILYVRSTGGDASVGLTARKIEWLRAFAEADTAGLSLATVAERQGVALVSARGALVELRRLFGLPNGQRGGRRRKAESRCRSELVSEARQLGLLDTEGVSGDA